MVDCPGSPSLRPAPADFRPSARASRPDCRRVRPHAGSARPGQRVVRPHPGAVAGPGQEPRQPGRIAPSSPGNLGAPGRRYPASGRIAPGAGGIDADGVSIVSNPTWMRKTGLDKVPRLELLCASSRSCKMSPRGMSLSGGGKEVRDGYVVRELPLPCAAPARDGREVVKQKQKSRRKRNKRAKP